MELDDLDNWLCEGLSILESEPIPHCNTAGAYMHLEMVRDLQVRRLGALLRLVREEKTRREAKPEGLVDRGVGRAQGSGLPDEVREAQ